MSRYLIFSYTVDDDEGYFACVYGFEASKNCEFEVRLNEGVLLTHFFDGNPFRFSLDFEPIKGTKIDVYCDEPDSDANLVFHYPDHTVRVSKGLTLKRPNLIKKPEGE